MNRTGRNRTHLAGWLLVSASAIAAVLALGGTAFAGAGHLAVRTDGPVAIAGHLYPAGQLELQKASDSGHLWALVLDGRQVALVFREGSSRDSGFRLYRDEAGLLHVQGVRIAQVAGGASEYVYRRSGHTELHAAATLPPRNVD
jgi:hypothetical protein